MPEDSSTRLYILHALYYYKGHKNKLVFQVYHAAEAGLSVISTLSWTPCSSSSPSYVNTFLFFPALSVPTSASNIFAHSSSLNSVPNVTFTIKDVFFVNLKRALFRSVYNISANISTERLKHERKQIAQTCSLTRK